MHIEQNVRTHLRIIHEQFRWNKIQKGQLAVILDFFFSLFRKSCIAKAVI